MTMGRDLFLPFSSCDNSYSFDLLAEICTTDHLHTLFCTLNSLNWQQNLRIICSVFTLDRRPSAKGLTSAPGVPVCDSPYGKGKV